MLCVAFIGLVALFVFVYALFYTVKLLKEQFKSSAEKTTEDKLIQFFCLAVLTVIFFFTWK